MSTGRPRLDDAQCRKDPRVAAVFAAGKPVSVIEAACGVCLDRPECLAWALEHEQYGFWGGKNPHQRQLLRRKYGIEFQEIAIGTFTGARARAREEQHRDRHENAAAA